MKKLNKKEFNFLINCRIVSAVKLYCNRTGSSLRESYKHARGIRQKIKDGLTWEEYIKEEAKWAQPYAKTATTNQEALKRCH